MKGHVNFVETAAITHFGIFSPQTMTDTQSQKLTNLSLGHDQQTLNIETHDDLLGLDEATEKDHHV